VEVIWVKEGESNSKLEKFTKRLASRSVLLIKYYGNNQVKEDEMGWACGMYGVEQKCILDIGGETWRIHTTWKTWVQMER
jgi:hypothetical protein